MEIDAREPVQLGDSTQWIRIRAAKAHNPLLLLVQLAALVFIFGHIVDLSIPNYRYRAIPEATSSAVSNAA